MVKKIDLFSVVQIWGRVWSKQTVIVGDGYEKKITKIMPLKMLLSHQHNTALNILLPVELLDYFMNQRRLQQRTHNK